jgi:hypothetical protein
MPGCPNTRSVTVTHDRDQNSSRHRGCVMRDHQTEWNCTILADEPSSVLNLKSRAPTISAPQGIWQWQGADFCHPLIDHLTKHADLMMYESDSLRRWKSRTHLLASRVYCKYLELDAWRMAKRWKPESIRNSWHSAENIQCCIMSILRR